MMASLFAGVSGLKNHQVRMNVIGNNIANVNTIGFKGGRVTFREALIQDFKGAGRPTELSGGTNPVQLGLGMQVSTIDNLFRQGGLETTGQVTDLAVQGAGFFILSDNSGVYYSRAGAFGFDGDSHLVDPSTGLYVQGRNADVNGNISLTSPIGQITVPFGQQDPPSATTEITIRNNLNSTATTSEATGETYGTTGIETVSGTAVNGAGGLHVLTITANRAATNSTFTGSNYADDGAGNPGKNLLLADTLAALGVTDITGFSLQVDGGTAQTIDVSADPTINGLINAISALDGVTASLVGGEIQITRDTAGTGDDYNITSSATSLTLDPTTGVATAGNIVGVVLGGTVFADNGIDAGQAFQASYVSKIGNLTGSTTLASLGVSGGSDSFKFTLYRDNASKEDIVQVSADATIDDLISSINLINDVTAELVGGKIRITRNMAGADTEYNFDSSTAAAGNIIAEVFGVPVGDTLVTDAATTYVAGQAHAFTCSDEFTATDGTVVTETLGIYTDTETGLATKIEDLGGGGVEIIASSGLQAGVANISTEDTTHAMSMTVYDEQGGQHSLTIEFTKSVNENEWTWDASFLGSEIPVSGQRGTVKFNADGSLLSFTTTDGSSGLTFNPNNGASISTIDFNTGTTNLFDGLTGFTAPSNAAILTQDGYGVGILDKISIDGGGNIYGIFTNGVTRVLAQILLADFNNQAGLVKAGQSLYKSSPNTGEPMVGAAGETIAASISSGALEASSIDIAEEFTSMITAQRGFQANARVITTSDAMIEELVNLKR